MIRRLKRRFVTIAMLSLLGILLVYFVMVAQFQSLKSPFIVMFPIPLAFTGGFIALLLTGFEVSIISMIGFVMLVGIIVNNGIVLVEYINQLRAEGMERREAILRAEGEKKSTILVAEGNKESAILEAQAEKESAILRAEAERRSPVSKPMTDPMYMT